MEPCDHRNRAPLMGNFGRGPAIAEKCIDCGAQWKIQADGSLMPVAVDPDTGVITPDLDRLKREGVPHPLSVCVKETA